MTKESSIERLSYSVREAAMALGISSRMLHEYIKNGSITHFRMGTRVLIPADALRAFIERKAQKP